MSTSARGLLVLAASATLAVASSAGAQSIIYVDDSAPAGGNGAAWGSAYDSLHAALAASVSGDEVRVAAGLYRPAAAGGSRATSFVLKPGVRLLGGYAGVGAADPDDRDPAAYVTNLSGDLNGNDGPAFANIAENSHHVLVTSGVPGPSTRIDGFLISGGNATGASVLIGAGVYIPAGNPTIASCTFLSNSVESVASGGGAVGSFGGATFIDCNFTGNRARYPFNTANGFGGAVYLTTGSFTNCTFSGNIAREGGAVYAASTAAFDNCVFTGNSAFRAGAIYRASSAAMSVTGCTFDQNSANEGGAIGIYNQFGSVVISGSTFTGNSAASYGGGLINLYAGMTISRCVFSGNSAGLGGGAVASRTGAGLIVNCTIANNTAVTGGGGVVLISSDSTVQIRNSILWENTDADGAAEKAQIFKLFAFGTNPSVNYSCVMGLTGGLGGAGNIDADPLFTDASNGDYSLAFGSPCVDAGDPDPIYNDPNGTRNDMGAINVLNAKPAAVAVCQQLTNLGDAAIVRLDASGSSDAESAAADLTYEWFVDGSPVCAGSSASCAVIEVPMTFGSHSVTLRVSDPGGLADEDTKVLLIDPASLALLDPTDISVDFQTGEISLQGEISLPATVDHSELVPVISASLSIGGVTAIPGAQQAFTVGGSGNAKWTFAGTSSVGAISQFDVDWGGSRFLYRAPGFPVRLQSDTITSSQSVLSMDYNVRRTGAFTLQIGDGVLISVAADGEVTANVPVSSGNRGKEAVITLPFPITELTAFTFGGGLTGSINTGDYLSSSVGRFRIAGHFDPALLPDGVVTSPRTVDLSLGVGAQGYSGTAATGPSGVITRDTKWRFRK